VAKAAFTNPLVARVSDQYGNRIPNVLVTFTAPNSGASALFVGGPTAITNGNGLAIKSITANTVSGTYSITATAAGGNNPSTSFTDITNTPGTARFLVLAGYPSPVTAGSTK
jgi:hypothetical protein